MNRETEFQARIDFDGDISSILKKVCEDFDLGSYQGHRVILNGYEDFNLVLTSGTGKHFVKIFASEKSLDDCVRYIEIVKRILDAGVSHPRLYTKDDEFLYESKEGVRLVVMDHIDGETFYEHNRMPTEVEVREVTRQAAIVNKVDYKPIFIRDSWAIPSFIEEYNSNKQHLSDSDRSFIEPLIKDFKTNHEDLPHALVHGDLIKPNVMRRSDGKIFLIDFSVANYYPRVYELAWLLCNMFFDASDPAFFQTNYEIVLSEYQKEIQLTQKELDVLAYFIKIAHAMHVIGSSREAAVNGNNSAENQYWLKEGRAGLAFMDK